MKKTNRVNGRVAAWFYQHFLGLYLSLVVMTQIGLTVDTRLGVGIAPMLDILLLASIIPLALFTSGRWLPYMKTPFFTWYAFTALFFVISLLRLRFGDFYITQIEFNNEVQAAQKLLILGACSYIAFTVHSYYFRLGFTVALILIPGLVILDFFAPSILSPPNDLFAARASGTYLNPNQAAEAIVLICVLNIVRLRGFGAVVIILLVSLALVLTFSRAGMAASLILSGYLMWRQRLSKLFIIIPILVSLFLGSIIAVAEGALEDLGYGASVSNVLYRLEFFSNISADNVTGDDGSSESRTEIIEIVLKESLNNPIFGHAVGTYLEYEIGPHNLPVHLTYKMGVFGFLIWAGLAYIIFKRGNTRGLGLINPALVFFLWFSLFSHNTLDSRSWAVFLAFVLMKDPFTWHGAQHPKNTPKNINRLLMSDFNPLKPETKLLPKRKRIRKRRPRTL